jgi:thiol:disulfide interchange protein DsbA
MKRREFFAGAASLATSAAMLSPGGVLAQAGTPQAGADFVQLKQPAPVEAPAGKIEVVEFFWYSCPHCHAFDPALSEWVKRLPKDVAFRRVPIAFRDDYVPQQKLYFALESMGLLEKLHSRVFAAIHTERQNLNSADAITEWIVKQGVDRANFLANFNSFSSSTKVSRATQLMNAYAIEGVPAMGVAGRFYTDGGLAKSMEGALRVTDFLIGQVRAKR